MGRGHTGLGVARRGIRWSVSCLTCGGHRGDLTDARVAEMASFLDVLDLYGDESMAHAL